HRPGRPGRLRCDASGRGGTRRSRPDPPRRGRWPLMILRPSRKAANVTALSVMALGAAMVPAAHGEDGCDQLRRWADSFTQEKADQVALERLRLFERERRDSVARAQRQAREYERTRSLDLVTPLIGSYSVGAIASGPKCPDIPRIPKPRIDVANL